MNGDNTADRLEIAECLYRYAEAVDIIGANPVKTGDPDPGIERAADVFRTCLAEDVVVRLFFEGRDGPPVQAGDGGQEKFASFVRAYFTDYGYVQTYHLVGNIRIRFTGPDTAAVRSYINSEHWMADGRFLSAPIEYDDEVVRSATYGWLIRKRDIVVWRWWVTDGYAPDPTDPTLARPAQ